MSGRQGSRPCKRPVFAPLQPRLYRSRCEHRYSSPPLPLAEYNGSTVMSGKHTWNMSLFGLGILRQGTMLQTWPGSCRNSQRVNPPRGFEEEVTACQVDQNRSTIYPSFFGRVWGKHGASLATDRRPANVSFPFSGSEVL
jgi:hypothetical protein